MSVACPELPVAMPFMICHTPRLSVGSAWPAALWIAAIVAWWSQMVATERRRSSARWAR